MLNTSTSTCSYGSFSVRLDRIASDDRDFCRSNLKTLLNDLCECGCRAACAVCDSDQSHLDTPVAYLYRRHQVYGLVCEPCDTAIQAMLVQPALLRQAADFLCGSVRVHRAG